METIPKPLDCHKCRHYYVTWDKHHPHGCRAMKFKSKGSPALTVIESSGQPCLLFAPRENLRRRTHG